MPRSATVLSKLPSPIRLPLLALYWLTKWTFLLAFALATVLAVCYGIEWIKVNGYGWVIAVILAVPLVYGLLVWLGAELEARQ